MSTSLSGLSLTQLRCLVAVVEAGSFAEAAKGLGMTTSGASKTITRLEAAYGLRLLYRSTHAVTPTEAGEQMLEPARAVLRGVQDADARLADLAGSATAGRVRISAPTAFVRTLLMPMLPSFIDDHPDILLDVRAADSTVDLAQGGIDLALRSGPVDGLPGHIRQTWFSFPWVACAAPSYLARHGTPRVPADLASHHLIGFRNTRTGVVEGWRLRGRAQQAWRWRLVVDDAEAAWRAALAGIGIAWAPHWLATAALASGDAIEVLQDWRGPRSVMSILRRGRGRIPNRVQTVVDFLRSQAAMAEADNGST